MATKFVLLAALLAASVAFATATTYTTVVTTTVSSDRSEQGQGSWESCQQEIQQVDPNRCRQYFSQGQGKFLRSMVGQEQQEQSVEECCNTIRQARPECRCHAIQYAFQQHQEGSQQEQSLKQRAEQLPQLCQFRSPWQCSLSSVLA